MKRPRHPAEICSEMTLEQYYKSQVGKEQYSAFKAERARKLKELNEAMATFKEKKND